MRTKLLRSIPIILALSVVMAFSAFAAAPTIISQPQKYYFSENITYPATAYFNILASGENLTYEWQYSQDGGSTWLASSSSSSTSPNYCPEIRSANAVNVPYLYRCIVHSTDGEVVSDTVSASVQIGLLSLSDFLDWTGDIVTGVLGWTTTACEKIITEPLLFFTVGFLAVGGAVAVVGRLLRRS